jgi:hypothetical protein
MRRRAALSRSRAIEKDRWGFPRPEESAARGYAILGDVDRALPLLERAVSQPTQWGLTPAFLRLDPIWDPLRKDPRFAAIAASVVKPNSNPPAAH